MPKKFFHDSNLAPNFSCNRQKLVKNVNHFLSEQSYLLRYTYLFVQIRYYCLPCTDPKVRWLITFWHDILLDKNATFPTVCWLPLKSTQQICSSLMEQLPFCILGLCTYCSALSFHFITHKQNTCNCLSEKSICMFCFSVSLIWLTHSLSIY